jgi:hypothetical protein
MKERGIRFDTEMVKAILAGRKTQTRRVVTWPRTISKRTRSLDPLARWKHIFPHPTRKGWIAADMPAEWFPKGAWDDSDGFACPFGVAGDRLYVREAIRRREGQPPTATYLADLSPVVGIYPPESYCGRAVWQWPRSTVLVGRFMPRWATRLFLEVTDVRVERLQSITEADAIAEAAPFAAGGRDDLRSGYVLGYSELWDSLNARRGYPWVSNPFCWVLTFRRV